MSALAGLGRGLMGFSNLLGEHEKMNRAERQRQVEYEREQHLQDLQHKRQLALQQDSQKFQGDQNALNRTHTTEQNEASRTAAQQEAAIERAARERQGGIEFGQKKELIGLEEEARKRGYQQEADIKFENAKKVLDLEKGNRKELSKEAESALDDLGLPDAQKSQAKAMLRMGMGPETILTFLASGKGEKDTWDADAINSAYNSEAEAWQMLSEEEQEEAALDLSKVLGRQASISETKDHFIADGVNRRKSLGGGGGSRGSALNIPTGVKPEAETISTPGYKPFKGSTDDVAADIMSGLATVEEVDKRYGPNVSSVVAKKVQALEAKKKAETPTFATDDRKEKALWVRDYRAKNPNATKQMAETLYGSWKARQAGEL